MKQPVMVCNVGKTQHTKERNFPFAAGVATAFAARDILGNMLSGVFIQFTRPFTVGDSINVPFTFSFLSTSCVLILSLP
jgi:hypothetical protein